MSFYCATHQDENLDALKVALDDVLEAGCVQPEGVKLEVGEPREGDLFDGYEEAENYRLESEAKEKAKVEREEKKKKKMEKDRLAREKAKEKKAERENVK